MKLAGQHLIVDAHFKDKDIMNNPSFIDNVLIKITEVAGMTMAVPPISLKYPVSDNNYEIIKKINELNTISSELSNKIITNLRERDNGKLGGYGVSGTAIWVESHLAIHTWTNEDNFVSIDMFSCKKINMNKMLNCLTKVLKLSDGNFIFITRYKDEVPFAVTGKIGEF